MLAQEIQQPRCPQRPSKARAENPIKYLEISKRQHRELPVSSQKPAGFPVSADKRYNLHTTGLFPGEKYKGLVYNKEYGDTLLKENQGFS